MIKGHLVEGVEHQGDVFECHLVGNWEPLMVAHWEGQPHSSVSDGLEQENTMDRVPVCYLRCLVDKEIMW